MKAQNYEVKKTLRFTKNASVIGAAVGSVPVVFIVAYGAAMNYTGYKWLSFFIGALAVGLFAAVVEYGMKTYFPYGISGVLSGKAFKSGWRTSALFIIILGLGLSMMYASGYMSFEGRKEAANLVAGDMNTSAVDQVAANVSQSENELLRIARSEKAAVQREIKQREQTIRKANANLASLEASGNAWAANKLQRIIDTDKELKRLRSDLQAKSETVTTLLKGSGVSKAVESVAAENQLKLKVWEQRHNTSAGLVGIFGIACILIFAFSATTLELFDIVEGTDNNRPKSVRTDPANILPVAGGSVGLERKVDTALKQSFQNRDEIGVIKASVPVRSRPQPSEKRSETVEASGTDNRRVCKNGSCNNDLDKLGKRRDAKYCSPKCRKNHHENKNKT